MEKLLEQSQRTYDLSVKLDAVRAKLFELIPTQNNAVLHKITVRRDTTGKNADTTKQAEIDKVKEDLDTLHAQESKLLAELDKVTDEIRNNKLKAVS